MKCKGKGAPERKRLKMSPHPQKLKNNPTHEEGNDAPNAAGDVFIAKGAPLPPTEEEIARCTQTKQLNERQKRT